MDAVQLKIEWAEKHIEELHAALLRFSSTNPYCISAKQDSKTGETVYYVAKADDVTPDILLLTGDILQNLRTALDYLVCELVEKNSSRVRTETAFPISTDPPTTSKQQASFDGRVQGMRKEAIDIIKDIKPYKGGNDVLWRLHRLNILDKHRLLLTAGAAAFSFNAGQHFRAITPSEFKNVADVVPDYWAQLPQKIFPLIAGAELYRELPLLEVNKNIEIPAHVSLNEVGICEGEPIISVVRQSFNTVRRIIERFAGIR